MKTYHVHYRNTQGTFLRILMAVQRRGLDMSFVHAEQVGEQHLVTLVLDMNAKQTEQVCREWHAIVDVQQVSTSDPVMTPASGSVTSHPFVSKKIPRVAVAAAATA